MQCLSKSIDMIKIKSVFIIVSCSWNRVYSHSEVSHFLSGKCLSKAFMFLTVLVLLVYYIFVCVRVYMYILFVFHSW